MCIQCEPVVWLEHWSAADPAAGRPQYVYTSVQHIDSRRDNPHGAMCNASHAAMWPHDDMMHERSVVSCAHMANP